MQHMHSRPASVRSRSSGTIRATGLAVTVGLIAGCSNAASIPDFGAPNTDNIVVFPANGLVRGRGLAQTVPFGATHMFIKSHPNGGESIPALNPLDGGFEFSILALSGNILEFSWSGDGRGVERGAPSFIEVPVGKLVLAEFVCCRDGGDAIGICQSVDARRRQMLAGAETITCPQPETGATSCRLDEDCGFEEGEWISIDLGQIRITQPDSAGEVAIQGVVEPRSLVSIQNRGLSGVGQPEEQPKRFTLSDNEGDFAFTKVRARGDDELVLQVESLDGFRSPAQSFIVDDSTLAGIDVTGVFPWQPLRNGEVGTVAIQLAPYGEDGLGVCPNHQQEPQTCFSGGLLHSMITLESLQVDSLSAASGVTWNPTPVSAETPEVVGRVGDVRAGPVDVVLVVDMSANANQAGLTNNNPDTVEAVASFIQGLRQRDQIGVVTFAGDTIRRLNVQYDSGGQPTALGFFPGGNQSLIAAAQTTLSNSGSGANTVFKGIEEAAEMIERSKNPGRIVVITSAEHVGEVVDSETAFKEAFDVVDNETDFTRAPTRVDIVGVGLRRTDKFEDIKDITQFTGGEFFDLASVRGGDVNQLELILADIRSTFSGSFLLLYDIAIPSTVGKAARLEFNVRMNGVPQAVPFSGLLRVDLAAN